MPAIRIGQRVLHASVYALLFLLSLCSGALTDLDHFDIDVTDLSNDVVVAIPTPQLVEATSKERGNDGYILLNNDDFFLKKRVKAGDYIIGVDGASVTDLSLSEWIDERIKVPVSGNSHIAVFPIVDVDTSIDARRAGEVVIGANGETAGIQDTSGKEGVKVKGFIKVEIIHTSDATVRFRPSSTHRKELEDAENERRQKLSEEMRKAAEQQEKEEQIRKDKEAAERLALLEAKKAAELAEKLEREEKEREKLAAAAQAAAAALLKRTLTEMRKSGEAFQYTAEFKVVGPMGLRFDMGNVTAVIMSVEPNSPALSAGIRAGDQLVAVNNVDTSKMGPTQATRVLVQSEWPRSLVLSVPEVEVPKVASEFSLEIFSPHIAAGTYPVRAPLEWGGNITEWEADWVANPASKVCTPYPILSTRPVTACKTMADSTLSLVESDGTKVDPAYSIVLVDRGICSIVEKASNIQDAIVNSTTPAEANRVTASRSGLGMVVLNNEESLSDMPPGNLPTVGITLPVGMLRKGDVEHIKLIRSSGVQMKATLAPTGMCNVTSIHERPKLGAKGGPVKDRPDTDTGGRLTLASSGTMMDFDWHLSLYGPPQMNSTFTVVMAQPPEACDAATFTVRAKGSVLIALRGGCSFSLKGHAAQKVGAAGLIIANIEKSTLRVMATDEEAKGLNIFTTMVSINAWDWVYFQQRFNKPIIGKFFQEDYYGGYG